MSLLNLSLPEFLAIFSTLSAVVVTLYLLDRSRRKVITSSLRFWKPAGSSPQQTQKRRIQQPWSLLLQLLSIALLLLAIAQLQFGPRLRGRDHILLLDTSAWMGARTANGTLMDDARRLALQYVRSLPSVDRVLVVRADGLTTPAGAFESNRKVIERAIRDSSPGSSALNLEQALRFAAQFERLHSTTPGEIVFCGAGRVAPGEPLSAPPANLRVLEVKRPVENAGLRRLALKPSEQDPNTWDVFISARNYGQAPRTVPVELRFGGAVVGARQLTLVPGTDSDTTFQLRTRAAGLLEARLVSNDALPEDDRAVLEVPSQRPLQIAVYTEEPESLKPVLSANPRVSARFLRPSAYTNKVDADVVILDRFAPPAAPTVPAVWIEPPSGSSPVRVRTNVEKPKLTGWNSDHELGAGLRTKDVEITSSEVFAPEKDDVVVAEAEQGPVIVARPPRGGAPGLVALGFHPVRSGMRYELATPLLFANILKWSHPDLFQRWELNAGAVGTVTAALGKDIDPASVSVRSNENLPVPYTVEGGSVRFYSATPGVVRVGYGDHELVYSFTLPEVGESTWVTPAGVRRGVPARDRIDPTPTDLWPWLALLGGAGLILEWLLYGRGQRRVRLVRSARTDKSRPHWWRRKAS